MMSLFDLARSADTEGFEDAYGVSSDFFGQIQLFNESVRSGPSSRRRIIEVAPDVVMPDQLTVKEKSSQQVFVMAEGSPDWYRGRVIAVKHPALPVGRQFDIKSIENILAGTGGTLGVWAEPSYIRRVILEETSDYLGGYEMIYSAAFGPVQPGMIFVGGGQWFRTRETSRKDDIGLGVSEVVELYAPVQTLNYYGNTSKYDAATDSVVGMTPVSVLAFLEPLVMNFRHEVLGFVKPEAGDLAISVLKSAVPSLLVGDKIGTNLVLSVQSSGNTWTAHCRQKH